MMKFALLAVAALIASAAAAPLTEDQYQFLFTKFSQQFNKNYEVENVFSKYQTFKNNIDLIVAHNASGQESYKMGINQFADMTKEEFSQMMGFAAIHDAMPNAAAAPTCAPPTNTCKNADCSIDWSTTDKVAPIQNQGSCGSCWAFSSISGLESMIAIKNGEAVVKLSEQQALDCSNSNSGCSGGLMEKFYDDAIAGKFKNGICRAEDYIPYAAKKNACQTDLCQGVANVKDYCRMPVSQGTLNDVWVNQLNQGPITIGVAASSSAFQFYSSGVVSNCTDRSHNHAVNLVGYNAAEGWYRIRNSWSTTFGEEGYIRVSDKGNQCGLGISGRDIVPTPQ